MNYIGRHLPSSLRSLRSHYLHEAWNRLEMQFSLVIEMYNCTIKGLLQTKPQLPIVDFSLLDVQLRHGIVACLMVQPCSTINTDNNATSYKTQIEFLISST
jgi:hypothetical protein